MSAKVLWSPQARKDLLNIYAVISRDNQAAAERYFARFQDKAAQLSQHPRLGQRRADIAASVRQLVEPPFLMLYEVSPIAATRL